MDDRRSRSIRLFKPYVGDEELNSIREVFERGWLGMGPALDRFEQEWSKYIGCAYSVGVNSCTAALHLALAAQGFPQGKKVLVPAITFVSTAHAVLYSGLEPIFVDVDESSLTLDPEDLERKVTADCVAVIAVHLGGHAAPMEEILSIARRYGLLVVEDCANSAGGSYRGRKLGTWGDIGCFSFEEKKNMTTGDGGMICTNDPALNERLRQWRWVGIDRDTWKRAQTGQGDTSADQARHWYYEVAVPGYKYNMNDIAAAIGLAQLRKLDWMNARRAELIARYLDGLQDSELVRPGLPYELSGSGYWLFMIKVGERWRDPLMMALRSAGIATGVHFMPLPLHPLYARYDTGIERAKRVWKRIITLPLFPELTFEDVDYIVNVIRNFEAN